MPLTFDSVLASWYEAFDQRDGFQELKDLVQREFKGTSCAGLSDDLGNGLGAGFRVLIDDSLSDADFTATKHDIENRLPLLLPQPLQSVTLLVQRAKDQPVAFIGGSVLRFVP